MNFKNNWMNHLKFKNGGENCQNISRVQFAVYAGYIKKKNLPVQSRVSHYAINYAS